MLIYYMMSEGLLLLFTSVLLVLSIMSCCTKKQQQNTFSKERNNNDSSSRPYINNQNKVAVTAKKEVNHQSVHPHQSNRSLVNVSGGLQSSRHLSSSSVPNAPSQPPVEEQKRAPTQKKMTKDQLDTPRNKETGASVAVLAKRVTRATNTQQLQKVRTAPERQSTVLRATNASEVERDGPIEQTARNKEEATLEPSDLDRYFPPATFTKHVVDAKTESQRRSKGTSEEKSTKDDDEVAPTQNNSDKDHLSIQKTRTTQ